MVDSREPYEHFDKSLIDLLNENVHKKYPNYINELSNCEALQEAYEVVQRLKDESQKNLVEIKSTVDTEGLRNELHRYNELKDAAQRVIGSLADRKGVTVKELHDQYGLPKE